MPFFLLLILVAMNLSASPVTTLLRQNRLDDALPICRQFDTLKSDDKDTLFACAWVYYRTDKIDSGEKVREQLRRFSQTPEFRLLTAYSAMKRKKFEEARAILGEVQKDHRRDKVGMLAQEISGEWYEMAGQPETAAFVYRQLISDDSKSGRATWGLGRHYLALGDHKRAVQYLEKTAALWPKHVGSRFNLGVLYLGQDNLKAATHWLTECYRLDRSDVGVLEQLGLLFEKKGLTDDAIRTWRKAYELNKESTLAREKLAILYVKSVDIVISKREFQRALVMLNGFGSLASEPPFQLRRGMVLRNLNQCDKAIAVFLPYVSKNPSDAGALQELGRCYLDLNVLEQASNYFLQAIGLEPSNGMHHAWMAFLLEKKGMFSEARDEWTRATQLLKDPNELTRAIRRLASVEKKLKKKGQKEESEEK